MEKAHSYGARAVFFEAERNGRAPVPQAFIFDANDGLDDANFAELHKRLWSWGGVPLVYRAVPGCIQLFRCAHEPDFAGQDDVRSEEHTSELQSLMRISYAVFCLKKKNLHN